MSPIDLAEELDPITQTPTMTNDDSTPMDVDTDQQKKKILMKMKTQKHLTG